MPESENANFAKEKEYEPADSGHCSDDDASSYHTAPGDPDEQIIDTKIPTQPTVRVDEPNKPTIPIKQENKPTVHTEEQKQNPPHQKSLWTQIWGWLKTIWQKIKNIFTHSEKNYGLNSTPVYYSVSDQRITFNILEIPAVKKTKGYTTLYSSEADSQQKQSPEQERERAVGYARR